MLVIARNKTSSLESNTLKQPSESPNQPDLAINSTEDKRPSFVMERHRLAGAKPIKVAELLEQWFPNSEPRVELYARHNNLRRGWFAVGTELNGPGFHAIKIPATQFLRNIGQSNWLDLKLHSFQLVDLVR